MGIRDVRVTPLITVYPNYDTASDTWQFRPHVERMQEEGLVDASAMHAWLAEIEEANRKGHLFASMTGFLVGGTKPSQA